MEGREKKKKKKRERMTDGKCGRGKQWRGLSLTVAGDSEVMCAKTVLDVRQRQGGMS